jgi:peptide/nickel transport system substrate-binding protein
MIIMKHKVVRRPYWATLLLILLTFALTVSSPLTAQDAEETTLRIADFIVISTLDPIKSIAASDIVIFGQLYSRLTRMSSEGELEPGLAESWEESEDGLTYTFHLREAQFSDGSPITAEDVVFSYLRMRDQEDSAYSASFQIIADVVALDEQTVEFTLSAPTAPFLSDGSI